MAIITKPSIDKNEVALFTLSKSELALISSVVADSYFSDITNWKRVKIAYKSSEGNQREVVVFDATQASPVGEFFISDKSEDEFLVRKIVIEDFDNGTFSIPRTELNAAEFDVVISTILILMATYSFGDGGNGIYGRGANTSASPAYVTGLDNYTKLSTGFDHVLALKQDGTVVSWGRNTDGQLGDGSITSKSTPVIVKTGPSTNLTDVIDVAAGQTYSLFLKSDGTLWACGNKNFTGVLGSTAPNGNNTYAFATSITGLKKVYSTQMGNGACGINNNDKLVFWGVYPIPGSMTSNTDTVIEVSSVNNVVNIHTARSLSSGGFCYFMTTNSGLTYAWGHQPQKQLGVGGTSFVQYTSPQTVKVSASDLTDIIQVSSTGDATFFLKSDGTLWACGFNGAATNQLITSPVTSGSLDTFQCNVTNVRSCSLGRFYSYALIVKTDGTVFGIGNNSFQQLGFPTIGDYTSLQPAGSISNALQVHTTGDACVFVATSNTLV